MSNRAVQVVVRGIVAAGDNADRAHIGDCLGPAVGRLSDPNRIWEYHPPPAADRAAGPEEVAPWGRTASAPCKYLEIFHRCNRRPSSPGTLPPLDSKNLHQESTPVA